MRQFSYKDIFIARSFVNATHQTGAKDRSLGGARLGADAGVVEGHGADGGASGHELGKFDRLPVGGDGASGQSGGGEFRVGERDAAIG